MGKPIIEYDLTYLEHLLKDSATQVFVQKYDRKKKQTELIPHDKNKQMSLSWYGPCTYQIIRGDETYFYGLGTRQSWYETYNGQRVEVCPIKPITVVRLWRKY